jgi:alkylhydroperoxidase domain protein
MSATVNPPVVFTQDELGWVSWIDPLPEAELTERHFNGLVDRARAKSEYFRLLVRDPEVLEARTKTDKDIFYNVADGLPRAERELAAAATSRYNGCIYCASVHARFASTYSKRREDVQRLLDEGVKVDLGERWNAVVKASGRRRSRSVLKISRSCAGPGSTMPRSSTSSTAPRSSIGRTG